MEIREIRPPDTAAAFLAMRALRTQLSDPVAFAAHVEDVQRREGYRLVGVFEEGAAVAVAGFRISHCISWGRHLYVDDLSTLPDARRHGHGRQLLDWLLAEAARQGCQQLHLDSGVGADRVDAHRLYFNAGLAITAHHFGRSV